MNNEELIALKKKINEWLELGHIVPLASPYGHPILFAKNKGGGGLHLCINYHFLNANTVTDTWLLPCIDDLLSHLKGSKVFSSLDLYDCYY